MTDEQEAFAAVPVDDTRAAGSNGDSRSVLRNALTQYGSIAVNLLIGLLLTPALLHGLGQEKYGVYIGVLAMVGYLGLGELGIGTATVRRIAAEFARGDVATISRVASTSRAIYLGTATVGLLLTVVGTLLITTIVPVPLEWQHDSRLALLALGLASSFSFIFNVFPAVLIGAGRTDVLTVTGLIVGILSAAAQIATVHLTHDIGWVAVVSGASLLLGSVVNRLVARRRFPAITVRLRDADRATASQLVGSGWRNAVIAIAALAAMNADVLVVGAYYSAAAVAAYGVAMKAAAMLSTLTFRVSEVLVPTYSHHGAIGDQARVRDFFLESSLASTALALPGAAVLVGFGHPLLAAWLGEVPDGAETVLALLALSIVVAVPGGTAFFLLSGLDRLGFAVKAAVLSAVVNVALGVALTPLVGLEGPAIATLVMRVIFDLIIIPTYVCRALGTSARRWMEQYARVVLPSALAVAAATFGLARWVAPHSLWATAVCMAGVLLVHLAAFGLAAGQERRARYLRLAASFSKRRVRS